MNAIVPPGQAFYEEMSPTLLAAQPAEAKRPQPKGKDWGLIYSHLESEMVSLYNWRYSWWMQWQQLAQYILPRRYKWLVTANTMWRGSQINGSIVDSKPTLAMQTCAAGLWTGLTSPSRPWLKLGVGLPWITLDADGEAWLDDTTQRLFTVLGQSNFYNTMAQAFQDVVTFGTAPMVIYEDAQDVIRCYLPAPGEYYLATGARLSVDTFMREFTFTVKQIVGMFGVLNCPEAVRALWRQGGGAWATEFVICHAIEPNNPLASNSGGAEIRVVPAAFTFREVYWIKGNRTECELSRKGFHESPFAAARWSTVANDAYGRSPGMDALGDVKQLQVITLRKAEFIEKLVRPPMGADVSMKNEPSSIIPGHVTYTDTTGGRKGFYPLFEVQPQALMPMIQDIEKVEARIDDCFFVSLFMAISRMEGVQPRNELELTKRDLERLQNLGPFIHMFESEFADPVITRILAIMARRRMLKPMPESLKSVPLKIQYQSIMRLAQQSAEGVALKDVMATGGAMSAAAKSAGVPDPLRIINLDKAFRSYGKLSSVDPDIFYTEDEVAKHDQVRAHAQQQQQLLQATPAGVSAAKTLSETQLGGNTMLSAMVGGGAAPGA